MKSPRPIIGITADCAADRFQIGRRYVEMVNRCGGLAIVLPPEPNHAVGFVNLCDAIILSGGDDPITTDPRLGGIPLHPKAKPIDPQRQQFEIALLDALKLNPEKPALGICLGMQMMGLHAGGTLDQHLPDHLPTAHQHWDAKSHAVICELGGGVVNSHHRQALTSAGCMRVIATASDGVIEAIKDDGRRFYVGVQWHPERTDDPTLGEGLIRKFVKTAQVS
jgi:putative glutamine amidotransferase